MMLGTVGTFDNVDVPWLGLREDVDYQKALHELFDTSWALEDEYAVSLGLVKLFEPYDKNWWMARERLFVADEGTKRHMRQSRGRSSEFFVNLESVEYLDMAYLDRGDMNSVCNATKNGGKS